jgi:ligand-binding SRPBCC domain-containing protein
MKIFTLKRETLVHANITVTWKFFSNPRNLSLITPAELGFKIRTQNLPAEISNDLLIEYSFVPLMGIRRKWITRIKNVQAPFLFVDEQNSGPYRSWIHTHTFKPYHGQTLMIDEVSYVLPRIFNASAFLESIIRNKVESIFDYRKNKIDELFNA